MIYFSDRFKKDISKLKKEEPNLANKIFAVLFDIEEHIQTPLSGYAIMTRAGTGIILSSRSRAIVSHYTSHYTS